MKLPKAAKVYVVAVVTTAIALMVIAAWQTPPWAAVAGLLVIYVLSASTKTVAGGDDIYVSVSLIVGLASIMITGPYGAAFVCASHAFEVRRGLPVVKRAFNGAAMTLTAYVAGQTYVGVGGPYGHLAPSDFPGVLLAAAASSLAYFIVNVVLIGLVVALSRQASFEAVWRQMSWVSPAYLAYGFVGLLAAELWENVGPFSTILLLVPLFIGRWAFAQYAHERKAYDATVRALVQAIETKDYYTRGHSERVAFGVDLIARQVQMSEDRASALRLAGVLHDVGKLSVPTGVLQKDGKLTDEEFDLIKAHPALGLEVVQDIEFLQEAYDGILHHHERLDGRGYPHGLSGDQIPEFARIIGVADAFDAMTSSRTYRAAMSLEAAIEEMWRCAGTQFDPDVVRAFVRAFEREGWHRPERSAALEAIAEEMRQSPLPEPRPADDRARASQR